VPLGPLADVLADIRELMGASSAAVWDASDVGRAPTLLEFSSVDGVAPKLDSKTTGLVRQAADQGVGAMCTDADTIRFAATPISVADGARIVLTIASRQTPIAMTRDRLRHWLPRFAARIDRLRSLVLAQAAHERDERSADLVLFTAAQLQEQRSVEELGEVLCTAAQQLTGARRVALVRWHVMDGKGEVAYATRGHLVAPEWPVDRGSEVAKSCEADRFLFIEDATGRRDGFVVFGGTEMRRTRASRAIIPMRGPDGGNGALVLEADPPAHIAEDTSKNLRLLALLGTAALETLWEIEEINRRARTDALTGLANRQQFEERLTRIVMETNRFGGSCALVVIDIDRFKHVNDTYGHQVGDEVLKEVSRVLQNAVRTVDLCARYGGEEMALLLPQTELAGAGLLAERLRKAVCDEPVRVKGHEIPITISLGVAAYPEGASSRDELFAAADRALYSAKRAGRNKVIAGSV
jgi:diguanylate cyclase (GGDEF)-like protein